MNLFSFSSERRGNRLLGAILFGPLFFLGSFVLLFFNEQRAVQRSQAIGEGRSIVRELAQPKRSQENEGALVHASGPTSVATELEDSTFGISAEAIRLVRKVEMYQWHESSRKENDRRRYYYEKKWSEDLIDSSSFRDNGYNNPSSIPFQSDFYLSSDASIGELRLSHDFIEQMTNDEPLPLDISAEDLPSVPGLETSVAGNQVSYRKGTGQPEIGDVRVTFTVVKPSTISVIGKQERNSIVAYPTSSGGTIALLGYGQLSATQLFDDAQRENTILTWLLRAGGAFMMFIGLVCLSGPIVWLVGWIPGLGGVAEAGVGFLSLVLAAILSLLTIAVSWLVVRPLLSAGLFGAVVVLFFALRKRGQSAPAAARTVAPAPPPPPSPSLTASAPPPPPPG